MSFIDTLEAAKTLCEIQHAVAGAGIDELDARRGHRIRDVLEQCALTVLEARGVICAYLSRALEERTIQGIDPIAQEFRNEILGLVSGQHTDEDDEMNNTDDAVNTHDDLASVTFHGLRIAMGDTAGWHALTDFLEQEGLLPAAKLAEAHFLRSPQFGRLWCSLQGSYDFQAEYLQRFQRLYPDLQIPDLPPFQKVLETFSLEQWMAIRHLSEPKLILVPPMSFAQCVELINQRCITHGSHLREHTPAFVHSLYGADEEGVEESWQAFFVEGRQNVSVVLPAGVRNSLSALRDYAQQRGAGWGEKMDRYVWTWLLIESMQRGEPIDTESDTLLHTDPGYQTDGTHHRIPVALFNRADFRVYFLCEGDGLSGFVATRKSIGGNVPE